MDLSSRNPSIEEEITVYDNMFREVSKWNVPFY